MPRSRKRALGPAIGSRKGIPSWPSAIAFFVPYRQLKVERSLRKAKKAIRTHRVREPPGPSGPQRIKKAAPVPKVPGTPRPVRPYRSEPGRISMKILDRRAGRHAPLRMRTGIIFRKHARYNIVILNEIYLCLVYTHQLCLNACTTGAVKAAKQTYHDVRRAFLRWSDVLGTSQVVKQFWRVISVTLRLSERSAMQKGLPLCGNDQDHQLC